MLRSNPGAAARAPLSARSGGCKAVALPLLLSLAGALPSLPLSPSPLAAQDAGAAGWAVVPQIAFGSLGRRWEIEGENAQNLGPGAGPSLGAALNLRSAGSWGFEALAAYTPTDYAIDFLDESGNTQERIRGSGRIHLVRVAGSGTYRLRPDAPGYFVFGAGALYYHPTSRIMLGEDNPATDDESQWMPTAHLGAGIELGGARNRFRIEGRAYASRPAQDAVTFGSTQLDARSLVLDLLFSVGYAIRL